MIWFLELLGSGEPLGGGKSWGEVASLEHTLEVDPGILIPSTLSFGFHGVMQWTGLLCHVATPPCTFPPQQQGQAVRVCSETTGQSIPSLLLSGLHQVLCFGNGLTNRNESTGFIFLAIYSNEIW